MKTKHVVSWFEIPVADMPRAARFYNTILRTELKIEDFGGTPYAMFSGQGENAVSGALAKSPQMKPSTDGTVIYLNAEGDLDGILERVPNAGGKVLMGRTSIGEHGFISLILDTEGNGIGLYSST